MKGSIGRRRETKASKREQYFRSLVERAADAVYVLSLDGGRIRDCNEQASKDTGYSREELLHMRAADLEVALTENQINVLHASLFPGDPRTLQGMHKRKDGSTYPVEIRLSPLGEGEPKAFVAIVRDISGRKRAEDMLAMSQTQLEYAMELANLVNWELDVTTGVFTFNDRFYALYGTTAEIEGGYQMPADVYAANFAHPDEAFMVADEVEKAILTTDPNYRAYIEHRIVRRDGEIRHIVVRYGITKDEHGKTIKTHGANQDVTERKRTEEALALAEEQLRQSQKMEAIGQLAGGIAHDFNNLLTVVIGTASVLLEDMPVADPNRKLVNDIKSTADRAADLTRQILAFSRRQTLRPEVYSLNSIVTHVEPLLRRTLGEHIDLVLRLDSDLSQTKIDHARMEQVLMNLAVNSRDAMPEGGTLTIETTNIVLDAGYSRSHPWIEPGRYVRLAVSDTGCGMDEATRDRVFEPFFTTKEPGRGTGLGLSTAYGIVKQSGGSITVYSEPEHGTTFKVYLPAMEATAIPAERHAGEPKDAQGGSETIVLVEDEAGVRELLVDVLSRAGYRTCVGGSWREVLVRLDDLETPPDLLITDVVLPEQVDGAAVAARMRQRYPGLRVLFMSGYTRGAMPISAGLDSGVEFLEKPFELQALLRKVREMLDA
jgi:two-component system, cell cycle sensor histidine kinase and response regulator CckA